MGRLCSLAQAETLAKSSCTARLRNLVPPETCCGSIRRQRQTVASQPHIPRRNRGLAHLKSGRLVRFPARRATVGMNGALPVRDSLNRVMVLRQVEPCWPTRGPDQSSQKVLPRR
jgi:hypothetical protein